MSGEIRNVKNKSYPLLVLPTVLFVAFAADEAAASTDHYIEMQLDTSVMSAVVKRQLSGNSGFCPYQIPCPFSAPGTCLVDHLAFGPTGAWSRAAAFSSVAVNGFQNLPSKKVLYDQAVTVHVKTLSCALDPACSTTTAYPTTVTYELYVSSALELCAQPHSMSGAPAGFTAPAPERCLALGYSDVLGEAVDVSGTAVSLNAAASRIGVRIEVGRQPSDYDAPRINAWQSFLLGNLVTEGAGGDWSTFVHQTIFLELAGDRVADGLATVSGVELQTPIATSWNPGGAAGGTIELGFDVTLTDTPCPNDLDASPSMSFATGMNQAKTGLFVNGSVDWNPSDWDVFVCGLAFGGPVGSVVLTALAGAIDIDLSGLGGSCQAQGDSTFGCNQVSHPKVISLGVAQSLHTYLDAVIGSAAGLTMRGSTTLLGSGNPTHAVHFEMPGLGFRGNCGGGSCGYQGGLAVSGSARLCDVSFSGDSLGIFSVQAPAELTTPAFFEINVASGLTQQQREDYNDNPYGLLATIWSSKGVKTHQSLPTSFVSETEEQLYCGGASILHWAKFCLHPIEQPWKFYIWDDDILFDDRLHRAVRVMDERLTRQLGFGLVTDLSLEVHRGSYGVEQVTILGTIHVDFEAEGMVTQPLALDVAVPRGTDIQDDRELIAALLPRGYRGVVALDRAALPAAIVGAAFNLELSPVQLEAAAAR